MTLMNGINRIVALLLVFIGFELRASAQSKIITYAGVVPLAVSGAQATTQQIDQPASVISDAAGGFYFASVGRVYRVAADGTLAVVAGTGTAGFSGDGGPAFSAQLGIPSHLALDAAGNLFIADGNRIRKVSSAGIISTVAGSGRQGFSGDGGPASAAELGYTSGIAVDTEGNLFIADTGNLRIRKVTSTGMISTVAGTGEFGVDDDGGRPAAIARFISPSGVAVDASGNLFIADCRRVRKITPGGLIGTVAGTATGCNSEFGSFGGDGGPATSAQLGDTWDVAVDGKGNLFIADSGNNRIRRVTADGVINTVAGRTGETRFGGDGGPATDAYLSYPYGVAVDGTGNLFIADHLNGRIRKVTPAGIISTVAGLGIPRFSGDGGPAIFGEIYLPQDTEVDAAGNLFIADTGNRRIRKVTPAGIISTVAGTGGIGFSRDGGPATTATLQDPLGLALDKNGNLFIAETGCHRIRKVTPEGIISTVAGSATGCDWMDGGYGGDGSLATAARLNFPRDIAVDDAGNLFISDAGNRRIRKVTSAGIISTIAGAGGTFQSPSGLALDGDGNLFIADADCNRIRKLNPEGILSTVAGNATGCDLKDRGYGGDGGPATAAQLSYPSDVALDKAGNLFFADTFNYRVRKITSAGVISTVAGKGGPGFGGDFGPAPSALLSGPAGVAVDTEDNLFIGDWFNHRIRKVTIDPTTSKEEAAIISAVYPKSGPTNGNTRLRILGRNFRSGAMVRLGGVALSAVTFKSHGELVAHTPALAAGIYPLEVVQPDGTTSHLADAFTVVQLSKVSLSTPTGSLSQVWRIPSVMDSAEFRTNLGINNLGGVVASVQISLVDPQGSLMVRTSTSVPPFGMQQINHVARFLESSSALTGREGYLILESNQDIRAWASQVDNLSSDPSFELARSDAASRVLLPSSVSSDLFSTSLIVINASGLDGRVSLLVRDSAGILQASLPNKPIAGYGYLFFEDVHKAVGLTNAFGSIEIEAHDGIRIMAAAQIVSSQRTGAYFEGVDTSTASRSAVLYSVDNADFRTNLGINNPGATTANVTVRLMDKNGVPLGSLVTTVPPGGMTQLNRVNLTLGSAFPGAGIEGTLRLESDQDIIAWTSQIDNLTEDLSFVASKSVQSTRLLIPSTASIGEFKSSLVVANLDVFPATVELKFRDVAGNLAASSVQVIPGNGVLSSVDFLGTLGVVGSYGPLEIVSVSGKPILALSRVYSPRRNCGTFEGVQ